MALNGSTILQLPPSAGIGADAATVWVEIAQWDGFSWVSRKLTAEQLAAGISGGYVPTSTQVIAGEGLSGGGALTGNVTLALDVFNLNTVNAMTADDYFSIAHGTPSNLTEKVTFPNALKAIDGMTELAFPSLTDDFVPMYHAADGLTYKVNPSAFGLAFGNVPAGGTTGQVLAKASNTNYDTDWINNSLTLDAYSISANPTGATANSVSLTGAADTIVRIGGDGASLAFGAIDLSKTAAVGSGVLNVANGGTGLASGTSGGILGYTATGTLASSVALTANALVLGGGAGAAPAPMASLGTTTTVLHGNAAGAPTFGSVSLTADVSGVLPAANGGTSFSTYALGDTIYASATNVLSKLAGNTTTGIQYLSQTGNGAVSAAPAWATISGSDVTGAALTRTDDTNVTLTLGGTPATALLRAASITAGWTGQLSLARGGSNANLTASNGGMVYSNASAMAILSATVTAGQIIRSGASAAPSWSTATYPATTTINQLLYSSSANVIAGLATANGGILNAGATGVPALTVTPTLGVAGTSTGTLSLSGSSSGVVTIQPQAAAGTFNFNLPVTAGTSGYLLTSAGGGSSAMTWTNPTALGIDLDVGSTAITSGATTRILYDNAGVLGEYTITGTGTVVAMQTSPSLVTPALGVATATSLAIGGASIGSNALAATGGIAGSAQIWSGAVSSALSTLTGGSDGFRSSAANATGVASENTTSSSGTAGAFAGMYTNDGAPLASGDRLGGLRAGGSSSASAVRNSAVIAAYATQTWVDTSAYGSRWEVQTTTNSAATPTTKWIFGNAGSLVFGATEANTVPSLKPSSAVLQARLGDDSAFTTLSSAGLLINGSSSGVVSVLPGAAAAGTYNFNLPVTVGSAGQVLTSQGGGSTAMTWETVAGTGTVTSITPGGGLTSTLTATAPGSAITTIGTLSAAMLVNAQTGTTYTILDGDRAKLVTHSNGSAIAVTLPQAGAGSAFQAGWFYATQNRGAGLVTITPTTSTIDGAASLTVPTGQGVDIFSDGTNYFTHRGRPTGVLLTSQVSGILPLANGGTAASLSDPGADRFLFWDESGDTVAWMVPGNNITISGTDFTGNIAPTNQVITASGTYTKPTGCRFAFITVLGGGGAGGGCQGGSSQWGGGGGGSGGVVAYGWRSMTGVTTLTATIGAGGTGVSNADGNPGGNSSLSGTGLTTMTAIGGAAGVKYAASTALALIGSSGTAVGASAGDITVGATGGGSGLRASGVSGTSGSGGSTPYGAGGGGRTSAGNGFAGSGYGTGGSGASSYDATTYTGADGTAGIIVVTEYY